MGGWTPDEKRWLGKLTRLLRDKPELIRLYTLDGEILACKVGVSSDECTALVAPCGAIYPGCVLTDIHDKMDCGQK